MVSPFDVLDVDPDADETEIERAYRRRIKESHPDHGGSAEEFQAVRRAYEQIVGDDVEQYSEDGDAVPPDPTRWQDDGHEATAESRERSRVEYLDFECLDDHGWTLEDDDLFEKAADAGLEGSDYGRILVESDEMLLEAAENRGFAWPFACRGGACANCAIAVCDGDVSQPVDHILPESMTDRGIRLSCVGWPASEELQVVYNVKHLPDLDDLRLPPRPFEEA